MEYQSSRTRICTLVLPKKDVEWKKDRVVGRWGEEPAKRFYGPKRRRLVEDFVNWDATPDELARFVAVYGPLHIPERTEGGFTITTLQVGDPFETTLDEWRTAQEYLRKLWKVQIDLGGDDTEFELKPGEFIRFRNGRLAEILVKNLYRLMLMELAVLPADRFKICANKEKCEDHTYFIADHKNQLYCCRVCTDIAQRSGKRAWWNKRGRELERERKRRERQKKREQTRRQPTKKSRARRKKRRR